MSVLQDVNLYSPWQGCTNPGHHIVATTFCTVVRNICGSSVFNVLRIILPAPRIWRCLRDILENLCTPVLRRPKIITSRTTSSVSWGSKSNVSDTLSVSVIREWCDVIPGWWRQVRSPEHWTSTPNRCYWRFYRLSVHWSSLHERL
jgi:hypothetical protein